MPKLTKRVVDAARPEGAMVILWDTEVRRFGLKVTGTGAKSYILNYRLPDRRERRITIGKHGSPWTCDSAREKALELLRKVATGEDPLEAKAQARNVITIADLAKLYLAEGPAERPSKKADSWRQDRGKLARHIIPLMGKKANKSITPADVARFQADVANGKSATVIKTKVRGKAIVRGGRTTAARCTACVATMLQFALKRGLIALNPAAGIELYKGEKKERFLTASEVTALFRGLADMEEKAEINPMMAAGIRLLMLTGCRKSEILTLRWAWVDFDRGCLRLPDSKTGAKVVQLAGPALQILADLPRTSPYVLPAAKGTGPTVGVQKAWEKLRVRATELARATAPDPYLAPDLSTIRMHDLRHSFASFAVAGGEALYLVGKVLGHRQSRTTEIYAHISDDPLRAVTERTAQRIAEAMRGVPTDPAGTA